MQEEEKSGPPAHPTTHRFVAKVDPARVSNEMQEEKEVNRPPTPLLTVSLKK